MDKEYRFYFDLKFSKQTNGYWVCKKWMPNQKKYVSLLAHRMVWEHHNEKITEKMVIHHKDGDKDNNDISNLEMLTISEHRKQHWKDKELRKIALKQLEKVRPIKWLQSEEGKKAVSEKGRQVWAERGYHTIICEHCGKKAQFRRWARFCAKSCYMKWRHKEERKKG